MKLKNVDVFILHHLDKDGVLSGLWCQNWFLNNLVDMYGENYAVNTKDGINYDIHPIQVNYGHDPYEYFGDTEITKDTIIFLVDFSFEPEVMEDLWSKTENIIWIDHHISVLKKFEGNPLMQTIPGIRSTKRAACELTYNYLLSSAVKDRRRVYDIDDEQVRFFTYGVMTDQDIENVNDCPTPTKYVASADLFDFGDPHTKPFVYGCDTFTINTWAGYRYLLSIMCDSGYMSRCNDIIIRGNIIIDYRTKTLNPEMMKSAQEVRIITNNDSPIAEEISKLKCIALNMPGCFNSEVFGEKRDEYDACIKYHRTTRGWSYTVYTLEKSPLKSYDIVSYFGGGGHPHAGGFQTEELALEFISR